MFFPFSPSRPWPWRAVVLAALCLAAYAPFLSLPPISDDYIQIELGYRYGPVSHWGQLAQDALYRCRATSIVLTYWTISLLGTASATLSASSLGLHFVNPLLVLAAGSWRRIGYRLSFPAACFFAAYQRPQEAVVWYAAMPELLVFGFIAAGLLCWIRFLETVSWRWYAAAWGCYLLALASKESAVIFGPLALALAWLERRRDLRLQGSTAPFFAVALAYYLAAQAAQDTHLHFNDGTFSVSAPFLLIELKSIGRLLWVWGGIAAAVLLYRHWRTERAWLAGVAGWMFIALLPYSFLTYQTSVPSRHTYLASVGIAILIGRAWLALSAYRPAAAVAAVCLLYQVGYLWIYKYPQYVERARPTELLLDAVRDHRGPVELTCFPYTAEVARRALEVGTEGQAFLAPADWPGADDVLRFNGCPAARN